MPFTSNYIDKSASASPIDLGTKYVTKEYLMNVYPYLMPNMKAPALWTFGNNLSGQLGDNSILDKSSPVQTIAGGTNWKQVSCGNYHTAAIKTDGSLWIWGDNGDGQLGINEPTSADKLSPVQTIAGGTNWKQVSCGEFHTAAIKTDGTLWLWGSNIIGELGDNSILSKSSPVQVYGGGTDWKHVSAGGYHTAAIKTDGTLWIWGDNGDGQLGINQPTSVTKSSPVQTIAGGTNWNQVACGDSHTAAIKTDGTLWTWGNNVDGQLGINTSGITTHKSSPVQVYGGGTDWKQIACNVFTTAAIKTDGTLWTWGNNILFQLGDGTSTYKSSPVQTILGGTNWKQVACASYHTAAIKNDGTLWTWGSNGNGQLGINNIDNMSSPVQTITGGSNWKQVDCGWSFTSAISEAEGY